MRKSVELNGIETSEVGDLDEMFLLMTPKMKRYLVVLEENDLIKLRRGNEHDGSNER